MPRQRAEEYVPEATRRELQHLVSRRERLLEEASELTNSKLARRHGVPASFVQRLATRLARGADPGELYRKLQRRLADDMSAEWMIFRCEDGMIRLKPMDTAQVSRDGFIGTVNRDTRVSDIEAMLED